MPYKNKNICVAKQGGIIENFDLESKNMVETLKLSGEVIGMYAQNDTLIMADDCGKFSMGTFEPEYKEISCLNIESKLARMAFHDNHFATGGEEIDLKVYSISSETPVFTAKNVKNDFLDLRQPVSILDIQFFPNSTAKLATSTKYHQLRIYDTKAQMRPVHSFEVGDLPLKHLLIIDEITALASDTKNSLFKIDLRNGRISGKFPGLAGAVTSIAKSPIDSSIIVGSLDRHVRIYDLNSTKLLSKTYVKQKVRDAFWMSSTDGNKIEQVDPEREDEEFWGGMERVKDDTDKKRKSKKQKTKQ